MAQYGVLDKISAAKFFSGLVQPKTHLKTFAYLVIIAFWVGVGWCVYVGIIKPHINPTPTTTQHAEQIQNITYDYTEKEALFLGIKLWKIRLGVSVK